MGLEVVVQNGWDVVRLRAGRLEVDVLPGKGGDILAARWLPKDLDLLWRTPWGLRPRGALPSGGDSTAHWLEHYPGGWQTIFPNGGDPAEIGGVEQGFHGEACLVPWEWEELPPLPGGVGMQMGTRLSRTPFELRRKVLVFDDKVEVTESVTNVGRVGLDVMWSHHPAFGAPFLDGSCIVETSAGWFVADDLRAGPFGDLAPGARTTWPQGRGRSGEEIDLSRVPGPEERCDRFGYLGGFERGWAAITNPHLGVRAELEWDPDVFPHAWLWLEAHATEGFPWFGSAYVLAIEPASSYPGQGATAARDKTGTLMHFAKGQNRTAQVVLRIGDLS